MVTLVQFTDPTGFTSTLPSQWLYFWYRDHNTGHPAQGIQAAVDRANGQDGEVEETPAEAPEAQPKRAPADQPPQRGFPGPGVTKPADVPVTK